MKGLITVRVRNLKPYAKYGLILLLMIYIVNTAYAEESINVTNNLSKPGGIALSWDDSGHIESCYQFLPIFQKYNATCTINVNKLKTHTEIDELGVLHSTGWEIASHGYNHLNSAQFISNSTPLEWLNQEIFPNIIEVSRYNCPVRTLAYPYSSRNAATDAILTPYFRTLRTVVPRIVNGNVNETTLAYYKWDNAQLLYGIEIDDSSSANLPSIEYGIDKAIKTGTVLVLYGHLITTNVTGQYETSTSRLDSILNYTSRNGGVFYHMGDLGNASWVPPPRFSTVTADYSVSTSNLTTGKSVTFVDHSINQTTELLDFGDGSPTSNTANVIHTYTTPGVYTANLTVKNDVSSNSMLKTIIVMESTGPVASFNCNPTIGTLPLNISFTDKSTGFPTSWLWEFGDGNISTSQNPSHIYYNKGNYTVKLTVNNDYGFSSQTTSVSVQSQSSSDNVSGGGSSSDENSDDSSSGSSSSSSGGSGGGSGGSPESQNNVEMKELSQTFIASGQSVKFEFPQKATPIVNISFDSKKTVGKTTTIVEMLKGKSALTLVIPSDEIYKYINIWIGNGGVITSDKIENAIICFKVEKSWVEDKKINKSSIILNRYNDARWNALQTILFSEDDKYLYLTAETPGFSPFAITGKAVTSGTVSNSQHNISHGSNGTNTESITASTKKNVTLKEETESSVKRMPGFTTIYMVVSLIIISLRKKK